MRLPDVAGSVRRPKRLSAMQMLVQRSYELEALPLPTLFERGPQPSIEPSAIPQPVERRIEAQPAAAPASSRRTPEVTAAYTPAPEAATIEQWDGSERRHADDPPDPLAKITTTLAEMRAELASLKTSRNAPPKITGFRHEVLRDAAGDIRELRSTPVLGE